MILEEIETVIGDRRDADPDTSYTARLLGDSELAQRKIMEEAFEVCLELGRPTIDKERTANEAADLLYHLLVAINAVGVSFDDVAEVLSERRA